LPWYFYSPDAVGSGMKKKQKFMRFLFADFFLAITLSVGVLYGDVLGYLVKQASGQARVILKAESRESYLAKPETPPEHRQKLELVDEIRRFAFDSLGLKPNKSYLKVYDQKGQPLLWVITASKKYALEPKTWKFPITGTVTYKGFFDKDDAGKEQQFLEAQGYETRIREVNAWSTLGYLPDPILSEMLNGSVGDLANVIIHELSHGTVFISGDVEESENLASFIGDVGAGIFLEKKFGTQSPELFEYKTADEDYRKLAVHLLSGASVLDSLYTSDSFSALVPAEKDSVKTGYIRKIMGDMDTLSFSVPGRYGKLRNGKLPNNAFFIEFRQYNARQNKYYDEFVNAYNSNLPQYIAYLKTKFAR